MKTIIIRLCDEIYSKKRGTGWLAEQCWTVALRLDKDYCPALYDEPAGDE